MAVFCSYIVYALLVCSLAAPPAANCLADHKKHVALFVFGDSLFDPGNNNYINTTIDFRANFSPYGESFFKHPTGRFSDGRLVPDFIAEFAKLPLIPAYFEIEKHGFINGVNFASGGAGCLVETHYGSVIAYKTQLQYFRKVTKQIKEKLGDKEATELISNAVYMLSTCNNDYLSPFTANSTLFNSHTRKEYLDMAIDNYTSFIKEIYKEGGRKFVIFSAAPVSCLPNTRAVNLQQTNRIGCFNKARVLPDMHNKVFPKKLSKLEKTLPGLKYSYFDFFKAATNMIDHPSRYGFKEGKIACCGSGPYRGTYSCGRAKGEYKLCKDVGDYLFFDSFHHTEKAIMQLATMLWNGDSNLVQFYSVKSLFELV